MRRRLTSSEHDEQTAVIRWWDVACKVYGFPYFALMAIPNAGKRSYGAAAWMRSEGLRVGIPDLFLAVPRCGLGGLWIEMKRGRNKPSGPQHLVIEYLSMQYAVIVAYSADEAIAAIKAHLRA